MLNYHLPCRFVVVRRTTKMAGGGVSRARSCAPRTRGGVHVLVTIRWPRAAHVRGALCGAYAAHVSTWAGRGLKSVLPAALLLSFCGSGGHRDMYVHARRCMFLVGLWDRSDVVARGRKSHAKVGIWSAMADNILCFRVFIFKFLRT